MHHTQHDHFETAVPEYQKHSALAAAIVALHTANFPALLSRENFEAVPLRRMGVTPEGTKLGSVPGNGKAAAAGRKVDDVVVSIEGTPVRSREPFTELLHKGGARKLRVLRRGEESIESVVDSSGDKDEMERARRAALRQAKLVAEQKKFW